MTLRARLLVAFAVAVVAVAAAGLVAVTSQQSLLREQVDDRLFATPLPPGGRVPPGSSPEASGVRLQQQRPPATNLQGDNASLSDVYIVAFAPNSEPRPIVAGQLLADAPDLAFLTTNRPTEPTLYTVAGVEGVSTFRTLYLPGNPTTLDTVIAIPLDNVHESVRELAYTFAVLGAVLLALLIAIASWVRRFGLQPLNEMTDLAGAVASGESDRRVDVVNDTTEAGRLGSALNLMLEERSRSDAKLRSFVSNASHELRTPLTSIQGYVDLYLAGGFRNEGELNGAMRRVSSEARRMHHLVEDLLLLAQFDEERPLDIATVRLDLLLGDVAALARAAHPGRSLEKSVPMSLTVDVDRHRLHQALTALVDNAMQHTPEATSVRIVAASTDDGVAISVSDDGPGLNEAEVASIFDRFARTDTSRVRRTGGSGLGLSIAQAIVQAHGGQLTVTSAPGQGSTFEVVIPGR